MPYSMMADAVSRVAIEARSLGAATLFQDGAAIAVSAMFGGTVQASTSNYDVCPTIRGAWSRR